ncbi:MAG: DUF3344 domain-containing protein [Methanosarcinaceae archaeon]|nr:DUF3344 domain-containing protein [Methanosarcinaceae archaeon]
MNIKKSIIAIPVIIGIMLVLSMFPPTGGWQGDGTPLYTIAEGVVDGGVYVDGGHGYTYENPYVAYFEVPEGAVNYARLYIPVWNYDDSDTMEVTVNGNIMAIREEPDYNSAWGVAGYCCNVTGLVHSGMNEVSVNSDNPGGGPYGVALVAVYEYSSMPPVRFWINEGNYALAYTNRKDTTTTTFSNSIPGKNATLHTLLVAGTEGEVDELYLGSELIGRDVGRSATGKYFDLHSFEITVKEPETTLRFERGDEGYIHPIIAVLVSGSDTDREYMEIHEQRSVNGNSVPVSVIAVCLITLAAILLKFRRGRS